MHDSDPFIIALNNKQDTAWEKLYEEFYAALCAYAAKLTQDDTGVEDLVQECIIGLWNSSLTFPNIKALASWLYRSVYTRSLNLIRDRKNSRRIMDHYQTEINTPDEAAIDLAIEEAAIAKLRQTLSTLSPQQSQIISMSLEGMKISEIAQQLGVSENTVKMQKKRAYNLIREHLGTIWATLLLTFFSDFF